MKIQARGNGPVTPGHSLFTCRKDAPTTEWMNPLWWRKSIPLRWYYRLAVVVVVPSEVNR